MRMYGEGATEEELEEFIHDGRVVKTVRGLKR
jgi:hypothetical protein